MGLCYVMNWFNDWYELLFFIVENGFGVIDELELDGMINDIY